MKDVATHAMSGLHLRKIVIILLFALIAKKMINSKILNNIHTLKAQYSAGKPFPHIVLDNFLVPALLDISLEEMKTYTSWSHDAESQEINVQVNKYFSPSSNTKNLTQSIDILKSQAPLTFSILQYLYSEEGCYIISKLSDIPKLQGDTTWLGGGMHKVTNGGKLSLHADFNKNWITGLYRRVNLLLYLNKDWKPEYGGDLELWNSDLTSCIHKVSPIFNRAIIFTTSKTSYHGHPHPLNIPQDVARYSLALYYFTKEAPENEDTTMRYVDWKTAINGD